MGTGGLALGPKGSADYELAYLCGMIRGGGHLGRYTYDRSGRSNDEHFRFRLALTDHDALERTQAFLAHGGVPTNPFTFSPATDAHREMHAIRASRRLDIEAIERMVRWPERPSNEWCKGFLAGIFDAEGSFAGSLRIANTSAVLVHVTATSLRRLGFAFRLERTRNENGLVNVRLLGGLPEITRFFQTVDPAISRKRSIEGIAIKGDAPL